MYKSTVLALMMTAATLASAAPPPAESPDAAAARMAWWRDAKFGMFIHWGVYSQAEGAWKGTTNHGEWLQFSAKIPLAEYTAFAKTFNPTAFDADRWARTAKDAGMKYMVVTAKHHDGFAMYDSPSSTHDVVDGSAFGRDPLKELAAACHEHGIKFCVYYSLGRDWEDPDVPTGGRGKAPAGFRSNLIDFPDESKKDFSKYFERKVKPQVRELMTQYGPIGVMWFDTYGLITRAQSQELHDLIRELQPDCIINNRIGHGLGDYGTPEQKIPSGPDAKPWETCMTISTRYWGFNRANGAWRSSETLVRNLIDITSKGGNYLLNVGPMAKGDFPPECDDRLAQMGAWLRVNGEAVYGCGPTPFGAEVGAYSDTEVDKKGKPAFIAQWDWRATTRPGRLYLHVFNWQNVLSFPAVQQEITRAYLLSDPAQTPIQFEQSAVGVTITLPGQAPDPIASVVCLELAEAE